MTDMNRRDALKTVAVASTASLLGLSPPQLDRALRAVEGLAASTDTAPSEHQPTFFTPHEWQTVRLLSDLIIPRDERSGGATDARVPEFMDYILADPDSTEASRMAIRGGLAWLDAESHRRFDGQFIALADEQRRAILDDVAWPGRAKPEHSHGVAFFTRFRDLTAAGFFSSAMGWRDVQYIGNVFVRQWDGCPPPALEKLGVSYDLMRSRVGAPQ
jgi:hypothetical protein